MFQESQDKKQKLQAQVTYLDVESAMVETVDQRVTPLAHLPYPE